MPDSELKSESWSGLAVGPAFDKEEEVLSTSTSEAFFIDFISRTDFIAPAWTLGKPPFVAGVDVKLITQGFFLSTLYFILQSKVPWVGGTV